MRMMEPTPFTTAAVTDPAHLLITFFMRFTTFPNVDRCFGVT